MMKFNKPSLSLSFAALCLLGISACSSGSSGTTATTDGGTTTDGATGEAATTSSVTSSRAVVNSAAGSTATSAQSAGSGIATLVRTQRAVKHLAGNDTSFVGADNVAFGPYEVDCDESGTFTLSGSESYDVADDFSTISLTGDLESVFADCTEDMIVEASDGTCLVTGAMDGTINEDFTFDFNLNDIEDDSDDSYAMNLDMTTDEDITMTVFGQDDSSVSVDVGFDINMNAEGTSETLDDDIAFTGTISIDGVEYDANEEIDTTAFSMEDLDCVQVEDGDGDGEEDAEPGEDGYDIDDDSGDSDAEDEGTDDEGTEDEGDEFSLDSCGGTPAEDDPVTEENVTALCACAESEGNGVENCEEEIGSACIGNADTMGECFELVAAEQESGE